MSLGYTVTRTGLPVIPMPDVCLKHLVWQQKTRADIDLSVTTGKAQFNRVPGSFWACDLTYRERAGCADEVGIVRGFVSRLNGMSGRFLAHDQSWLNPAYSNLSLSAAISPGDTQLSFSGVSGLQLSDWFQIQDGLYMVTSPVSGDAIQFSPPAVHPVAAGSAIECRKPGVVMRLLSDDQPSFAVNQFQRHAPMRFSAIEAKS